VSDSSKLSFCLILAVRFWREIISRSIRVSLERSMCSRLVVGNFVSMKLAKREIVFYFLKLRQAILLLNL
jgi:hypothetical protein